MALPQELRLEVARIQECARNLNGILADWAFAMPSRYHEVAAAVDALQDLGENLHQAVEGVYQPPPKEEPPDDVAPERDEK